MHVVGQAKQGVRCGIVESRTQVQQTSFSMLCFRFSLLSVVYAGGSSVCMEELILQSFESPATSTGASTLSMYSDKKASLGFFVTPPL